MRYSKRLTVAVDKTCKKSSKYVRFSIKGCNYYQFVKKISFIEKMEMFAYNEEVIDKWKNLIPWYKGNIWRIIHAIS